MSAVMIAAPTSGSGKTTIARGLMVLLVKKGYSVQPFKCGPDYIDTKFHEAVCGCPSINLDTFMASGKMKINSILCLLFNSKMNRACSLFSVKLRNSTHFID